MPQVPFTARYIFSLCLLTFCLALLNGCVDHKGYSEVSLNKYPLFIDDLPIDSLLTALEQHQDYLKSFPSDKTLVKGGAPITYGDLVKSLTTFKDIINTNPTPYELDEIIKKNYTIYKAAGRKRRSPGKILLTGYYEPVFEGSLSRQKPFVFPLYGVPPSLLSRKNKQTGKSEIGRTAQNGTFIPFWTRKEIETKQILKVQELAYLRDPLDAYLLHVQGSGRIKLRDNTIRSINYAVSNGLEYNSLGKLFVDKGLMTLNEVSIPAIRSYFKDHPEDITKMLHHNPRYIFFNWGDTKGPRGSLGKVLTPGRSVAVDQTVFPAGAIGYLLSRKPVLDEQGNINHWTTFSRFVLPQDSGAAIKGAGRVDLFLGNSVYAETAASYMKEEGEFFLLVQNSFELPAKIK